MLWLGIGLGLLAVAAWALVLILEITLWVAVAVTVLCVLVFFGVFLVRRLLARQRAAALERELLRQAAEQAERARPDRRAEILALQQQMKSALETLKRTKLGAQGGRSALYALPWYVVVGPPAAGKTTALTQSGLGFVAPPGSSMAKVRGTAGTRNCDWWFSERAILLDTAGRLATGDDDREEWLTFLDTVRKFRPKRPLEGLVVALSVESLLCSTDVELEETAHALRARIDEVMSRLEMVLPIYVLFTKSDLIAGFIEFFGDLTRAQRAQTWGASFALDANLEEPAPAIEAEFDTLASVLHARMLQRLSSESLPEVRAKILQFPVEFQGLKKPLAHFVEELCRPNPYQETPLLRGFYFCSGTQTGRALDRVLENMARGFNLPRAPETNERNTTPQSYFVTELFQRVIFPDRHLAVRSLSRTRRTTRVQALVAALVLFSMLLVLTPAALSYARNVRLVRSTVRDVDAAVKLEQAPSATTQATAAALDRLVGRVQTLEREKDESSVRGLFGPYLAEELHETVKGAYLERLHRLVSGPVQAQLVADVRGIGDLARMDAENFRTSYDDLKLYLMLCRPERLVPEWASERLAYTWARALRAQTPGDERTLIAHAQYFVNALAADRSYAFKEDPAVVSRAQGRLALVPLEELQYGWLAESARGVPPIRPENIFFGASAAYWDARESVEVPGLYTARGFQEVKKVLEEPDGRFALEPWVLGQALPAGADMRTASAERLRSLYFRRYTQAWSSFIAGLSVKPPTDVRGAIDELRVLSESEGPYVRLFRVIGENTRLDVSPSSLLEKGKEAVAETLAQAASAIGASSAAPPTPRPVSPVEQDFASLLRFGFGNAASGEADAAPSGLSQYLAQLSTLEVALSQLVESNAEPTQEFEVELGRTASAVQRLLAGLDARTRLVLEPLLMNPIRGSRAGFVQADYSALGERWKAEVWEIYNEKIAPRYPFAEAPAEVSLAEFAEFFRPDSGILWKFFKENLETRLERKGTQFVPRAAADPLPLRSDFLQCLNVAQEITEAVFGGGPEPLVRFDVQMHPVSSAIAEVSLVVDGKATVYRNEPERWLPMQWPGTESPKGAALKVRGAGFNDEIPRLGDFGLFRLFEAGGVKATGKGTLAGRWTLTRPGQPPVTIDIKPAKSVHPFTRGFFRRLRCPAAATTPKAIAAGGMP